MPGGRPDNYKSEYCQMIIDHMATGKSLVSFAASISRGKSSIYDWEKKHEEFSEALSIARTKCQAYWEEQGQMGMFNDKEGPTLNTPYWKFNMACRFGYREQDKKDVDKIKEGIALTLEDLVNGASKALEKGKDGK